LLAHTPTHTHGRSSKKKMGKGQKEKWYGIFEDVSIVDESNFFGFFEK
jgi:hypothetical protein